MRMRLCYAAVTLVALVTVGCPYSDFLSSNGGLAISGGGGSTGPDRLSFGVQPSSATAGDIITPAIQVTVSDSFGIPDTAFAAAITMAIGANPVGGNLSGTLSVAPVNGIASFGDLVIDQSGAGYQLRASAPGASSALSTTFTILAP